MKVRIPGKLRIEELQQVLGAVHEKMESYGITHVANTTLTFTLVDADGYAYEFTLPSGNIMREWEFAPPVKRRHPIPHHPILKLVSQNDAASVPPSSQ
jgi:hypothetical protein